MLIYSIFIEKRIVYVLYQQYAAPFAFVKLSPPLPSYIYLSKPLGLIYLYSRLEEILI